MEIPLLDRSNYLKGLLIIARMDNQLSETEISIINKFAKRMGFSSDFVTETIKNLLENKYITEDPLKFSSQSISKSFIEDGLKLALSENTINEAEISWLKDTAKVNGFDEELVDKKIKEIKAKPISLMKSEFALFSLI
ncbi:MAG: hypothetical protein HND39_08650 [Ignavibacteriota bacterium]|nr:MAG: hypothetical protein EDM72_01265 [Chlorobiota bacterium]MBE7476344.1 hypothetical protein [Ignavibacteriales bacterium]MBL1124173.1 hypothetical protein [Ignavibacteriota bacterium]MCE7857918.1 hypothetical protein [Ignavibacteria bacterium CHB3]MCZ7614521.1 hypothetical protein [Ignavibacteriaceae bacterium]MEB2297870.1 hypothetical protein [Ignavibacteria bacterium]